jgi:hypothetical protein
MTDLICIDSRFPVEGDSSSAFTSRNYDQLLSNNRLFTLAQRELLGKMWECRVAREAQEVRRTFDRMDINGDGGLSKEELRSASSPAHRHPKLSTGIRH